MNRQSFVLWYAPVERSSSLLWAYVQDLFVHCPVWISILHSFVHRRSGNFRSSTFSWAKGHSSPLVHFPSTLNLHILVLVNWQSLLFVSSEAASTGGGGMAAM